MVDIANVIRLTTGQIQIQPWRMRILPLLTASAAPTISGSVTGGSTVTAVPGTYSVPIVERSYHWRQFDSADGANGVSGVGQPFGLLLLLTKAS